MTPKQLDDLAKALKLTPLRKRFCEILAQDPERNRTKAYIQAGGAKKHAQESSSHLASMHMVRRYIEALTEGAQQIAMRQTRGAIYTLGESLAALTNMAAGREATEVRVYSDFEGDGKKRKRVQRAVTRFDRRSAHVSLVKHHTGAYSAEHAPPPPPQVLNVNIAVLGLEDLRKLRELREKVMHGGNGRAGNGNG